jgi:ATP-dependent DNA helicase PIF1
MLNVKQQQALEAVYEGKNILLTGPAGTGKSFTIKYILDFLQKEKKNYAITATTGTASVLVEGQTLNSFMGIGLGNGTADYNIKKIKRNMKTFECLAQLEVLIIDEISMLNAELFDKIGEIFARIKSFYNKNPDILKKTFGGLQLILVGDFCQLAPVNGMYCFLSKSWDSLDIKVILLDELIRQGGDILFQKILQIVRKGKCTDNIMKVLNSLKATQFDKDIKPTILYPLNENVDKINNEEIAKLKMNGNDYKMYKARNCNSNKNASLFDVELTLGAQAIIIRNIDISKGIVNGKRCIIKYLGEDYIIVNDVNNNSFKIEYFKDVDDKSYDIISKCYNSYVLHMPVRICYALSIHKSQGMTIDALELDLGKNIFTAGQAYTALSRAKSLRSIRIIDIDKGSFQLNPYVKKFYANIIG